jgi:hypothetical protein
MFLFFHISQGFRVNFRLRFQLGGVGADVFTGGG